MSWQQSLEKIRQEEAQYGDELNDGISQEEAERLSKKAKEQLGLTLPNEYIDVLKTVNGIEFNGVILYGADEELLASTPKRHVNGLIDNNLVWYENEWQKQYLFFGEGGISWYVYDLKAKRYCELDNPSGDVCEEFESFEQMLDKMLADSL